MSLSASLANALSGLTATSRRAEVVSSNVANALTDGYARRELQVTAQSLAGTGAGVRVIGVTRQLNTTVLADRRLADADAGNAGAKAEFLTRIETRIGVPGDGASLSDRVASFDASLVDATSRPDSQARLQSVLDAAGAIANHLSALTDDVQNARMEADAGIARQVDSLNETLGQIDRLNSSIVAQRASGRDASALMDQRQSLVDKVAEIVPVREVARDHDQIALYTTGGAILLEGNPARIGFSPVGIITADMTLGSGALSGLTINGTAVPTGDDGVLGGGTLGAMFAIRDDLAPDAQAAFDALARDLMERFADPAVDPTLASGQPGLFTDRGAAFDPLTEAGLAGRLTLNAATDPKQGGQIWRLRDGLGAATPGNVGDATTLNALGGALRSARIPGSGNFSGAARSAAGLAADVLSQVAGARQQADFRQSYTVARQEAMTELQLADGVDTDAEMQTLLLVEQAYSANARVVQTIDDLIQTLIGL
jgi:flagellar hook-associated protein 1